MKPQSQWTDEEKKIVSNMQLVQQPLEAKPQHTPTPKTNCKYCSCDLLDHNFDGSDKCHDIGTKYKTPPTLKYIVYYFPFKEGNEGKKPSQYPMLHETEVEAELTKRFLTFHTAAISHVEHREPTPMEIVADVPYAAIRAIRNVEEK